MNYQMRQRLYESAVGFSCYVFAIGVFITGWWMIALGLNMILAVVFLDVMVPQEEPHGTPR